MPMNEPLVPGGAWKRCCTCQQTKALTEFNVRRKSADGRQASCRECNKAYHYANWDRHMAQIRARTKRVRQQAREFVVDYLRSHPCVDCGEADIVVLEFDHLRDKEANVSEYVRMGQLSRALAEIEKCEVVCANCHRRRTSTRAGWYRSRVE
jgi:hypothetical protein